MNNKFDELTKSLAQSVTRRGALKKFGLAVAGALVACLGFGNKAQAQAGGQKCNQWHCANCCGDLEVYLCGHHRPKVPKTDTCVLIGPVDCAYCSYQCC